VQSTNAFERTGEQRARTVRACMCARAGAQSSPWSAAQLGR